MLEFDYCKIRSLGIRALGLGLTALVSIGCTESGEPDTDEIVSPDQGPSELASEIAELRQLDPSALEKKMLATAIPVSDDLYMIPKGLDGDGCEMFGPYSTKGATVTAIYYRQADGSFNITRDPAVCAVEMAAIGPDEDGCERYRAEPVNPDLTPTPVIYYRDENGAYAPHKPRPACNS